LVDVLSAILQIAISFGEILISGVSQNLKLSVIVVEIVLLVMLVVFSVREHKKCSQKGRGTMTNIKHVRPSTENQVGAAAVEERLFCFK